MNSYTDSDARKDPDRLEREIDQQRMEINETLRALEEKFSSREIAGQFMHYFSGPGRDFMGNLGSSLRANPVPAMLTAIGVAWLMMGDRNGANRSSYDYGYDYERRRRGMFEGARGAVDTLKQKAGELGEKVAHAGDTLSEKVGQAGDTLSDKAMHARDAMRSHSMHAREGFDTTAYQARDNFSTMAREQPLALGAVGIALGALLGAALPRTEHERRMLGRASERVKERGKEMAREGYEKASQVATDVAETAKESLKQATAQAGNAQDGSTPQQAQSPRPGTSPPL